MDPQQQQQFAGLIASMGVAIMLVGLVIAAFFIFCLWRIFTKAGLAGPLALIAIVPAVGPLIVLCILAFSKWNVVPVTPGYAQGTTPAYPPAYPPQAYTPPAYPPQNYPPAGPPTQL
jgi:heme/copper-type cytochrome/quinol oxidase subunit 2